MTTSILNRQIEVVYNIRKNNYTAFYADKEYCESDFKILYSKIEQKIIQEMSIIEKKKVANNIYVVDTDISESIEFHLFAITNKKKTSFSEYLKEKHMESILSFKKDTEKNSPLHSVVMRHRIIHFCPCLTEEGVDFSELAKGLENLQSFFKKEQAMAIELNFGLKEQEIIENWEFIIGELKQVSQKLVFYIYKSTSIT